MNAGSVPSGDMLPRREARLLVLAVALAVAGTTVAVVRSTGSVGPPADPRGAVVAALAARPGDGSDSARYVVRYIIEDGTLRRELGTYEGAADFRHQRFLARNRVLREGTGPPADFDSFVFAEWEYSRPAGEGHWRRRFFNPESLGAPTPELAIVGRRGDQLAAPSYARDGKVRHQIVDALVTGVVPAGQEEQHGAAVWRYRVTVDGPPAPGRLPDELLREMRAWNEGQTSRGLDVWVDGRGRLRKLSILFGDEEGRGFRVENEFWDFGRPGRLDLPSDLGDPTTEGGEGVTSFRLEPGVELDAESPGMYVWVFDNDKPGEDVSVHINDRPAPGADSRRRTIRMNPAAGRHLEPGDYQLVDRAAFNRGAPRTFDITEPDIDARCGRGGPRSGTLTLSEAVMYEASFYVRLHLRISLTCTPAAGGPPVSFALQARYHALT